MDARPAGGLDDELLALPAPPRADRLATLSVMALVVAGALALLGMLRADIGYFFSSSEPVDLGVATELRPGALRSNEFVRVRGMPMASGAVTYERMLGSSEYMVFPLAGQRNLYVQVPVDGMGGEIESMARGEFSGRLVRFNELGSRFSAVRGYLGSRLGMPVTGESYLLLSGEPPGAYFWAMGVALMCLLFLLVDVFLILRWFRPVKDGDVEPRA